MAGRAGWHSNRDPCVSEEPPNHAIERSANSFAVEFP